MHPTPSSLQDALIQLILEVVHATVSAAKITTNIYALLSCNCDSPIMGCDELLCAARLSTNSVRHCNLGHGLSLRCQTARIGTVNPLKGVAYFSSHAIHPNRPKFEYRNSSG